MKISKLLYTTAFISCMAVSANAEEVNDYSGNLTGDWGGARKTLADKGVDFEVGYTYDVMANVSGGLQNSARGLDNLDVIASVDGEKLFGAKGTSFLLHVINNNGGRPDEELVGSAQGIDNIETGEPTAKVFQAWVQQNFLEDRLSFLAGLYDVNSEFYVTDTSGLFIHSTYGLGTEVALSSEDGVSTFPTTSVAGRVKFLPTEDSYVQVAVTDAVPGDPNNPKGTHVQFNSGDGQFYIGEAGYVIGGNEPVGKVAVGAWYYTEESDDLVAVDSNGDPLRDNNFGSYVIGEYKLWNEAGDKDQGLSAFARLGIANEDVNQFDFAWSTGVVYTGLIPGRDEGQLGFGVAGAKVSNKYEELQLAGGAETDSAETALELTYSDYVTPWFQVQPDVQYIINPSADPSIEDAWVIGSRFTVNF